MLRRDHPACGCYKMLMFLCNFLSTYLFEIYFLFSILAGDSSALIVKAHHVSFRSEVGYREKGSLDVSQLKLYPIRVDISCHWWLLLSNLDLRMALAERSA